METTAFLITRNNRQTGVNVVALVKPQEYNVELQTFVI